jgi:hypothetical protein
MVIYMVRYGNVIIPLVKIISYVDTIRILLAFDIHVPSQRLERFVSRNVTETHNFVEMFNFMTTEFCRTV